VHTCTRRRRWSRRTTQMATRQEPRPLTGHAEPVEASGRNGRERCAAAPMSVHSDDGVRRYPGKIPRQARDDPGPGAAARHRVMLSVGAPGPSLCPTRTFRRPSRCSAQALRGQALQERSCNSSGIELGACHGWLAQPCLGHRCAIQHGWTSQPWHISGSPEAGLNYYMLPADNMALREINMALSLEASSA